MLGLPCPPRTPMPCLAGWMCWGSHWELGLVHSLHLTALPLSRGCSKVQAGRGRPGVVSLVVVSSQQVPWIAMVSKPSPSTVPWGPAVCILPAMRPCSVCFASCRDVPPSRVSVPVHDLGTPNSSDLAQLLLRIHSPLPAQESAPSLLKGSE